MPFYGLHHVPAPVSALGLVGVHAVVLGTVTAEQSLTEAILHSVSACLKTPRIGYLLGFFALMQTNSFFTWYLIVY